MSDLPTIPEKWRWSTMSVVCEKIQDGTHFSPHQSKQLPTGEYPYVTAKNVRPSGLDLSDITFLVEEDHRQIYERCDPKQGDVLLVKDGVNAGDAAINTFEGEISLLSSVSMLRPHEGLLTAGFLRYYLLSPQGYRSLTGQLTGTAIKRIILRKIREMPAPVAPLDEQNRIVAKIDELLSDLDAGVAALERAKANLKRYRAAVLKAAVEGKLTEAWRAEHPNTEPASQLLERILAERRQKWEANQLAKFAAAEKEPPKNWKEKYVEPTLPDKSGLPELPEGWCWTQMELLACDIPNAIGAGPFGTIFKAHDFRPNGIPIIFLRHVQPGVYLTRKPGFMDHHKWEELFKAEYSVFGGELLVTKLGEPPGTAAIYPKDIGPAMVTPDVIKMSPRPDVVLTDFVMNYMNSLLGRSFTSGVAFGTTRLRLTLPLFKALPVPLPPLQEQKEITARIAEEFSKIDSAEREINHGLLRAARLRQSILKQAFEGKLVPQDPTDEPASVLLERIKGDSSAKMNSTNGAPRTRTRRRPLTKKHQEERS